MRIGVPKEIKTHEYRVGITPVGVHELTNRGHHVLIETNCGVGIGCDDQEYIQAGAQVMENAQAIFEHADMIVKVKEPQPQECKMLRENQLLFTYLHLAPDTQQTQLLMASGCIAVAYETVTEAQGGLPLLAPMSEVAGRMAIQAGAHALEKAQGGSGVLLGGVPGVAPANVMILGGGIVGVNAARIAMGMGAKVTVLDRNLARLRQLDSLYGSRLLTLFSNDMTIKQSLTQADLVVGSVLIPGASAPKLITRDMLHLLKKGSVLVDVAIDQGGCFETSKPTTHTHPTFTESDIIHYCVTNMPGAVARTSTFALTNATLPYILELATLGFSQALKSNVHLRNGLNICAGKVTLQTVAQEQDLNYTPAIEALNSIH